MKRVTLVIGGFLFFLSSQGMLFLQQADAADIRVQATVRPQHATVGRSLILSIDMTGTRNASAPTINVDGFDINYLGPSTQFSITNGQVSASVQHRYSLVALKPGQFTVGPFAVEYQGQQYHTAPLNVTIAAARKPSLPVQRSTPDRTKLSQQAGDREQGLYLGLTVTQHEIYLHERIQVDVKLYVAATRVSDVQYPTFLKDGFSVEPFAKPTQNQQIIKGKTFTVLHFQTEVIPLRTGSLALGPAILQLNVLTRRQGGSPSSDPFFDRFFQNDFFSTFSSRRQRADLRSDPLTLTVLPLPEEGRPVNFSGAVGTFTLNVTAAPTELNAGDPITMRMRISGDGNLVDTAAPTFVDTTGFRIYEPLAGKTNGATKSFEQVLIPRDTSLQSIPSVQLSYFDPQARRYRTVESQPIALVVHPAETAAQKTVITGNAGSPPNQSQREEEHLGRDIVYIKDNPGQLVSQTRPWYGSVGFLLWQPFPVLLFISAWWYDQRRRRRSGDLRYTRFTAAGKQARQGLVDAERLLMQADEQTFYTTIVHILQGYLSAKLDLPLGGTESNTLHSRGVSQTCIQQIETVWETCEHIRFAQGAPGATGKSSHETLSLVRDIIDKLEHDHRQFQTPTA